MLIDTTKLMNRTFQSCRLGGSDAGFMLNVLSAVLDVVGQRRTLVIDLGDDLPDTYSKKLVEFALPPGVAPHALGSLSPASEPLFALVCSGTKDMTRLWAVGSTQAVRSVGYALHIVPDLLRNPRDFDPRAFTFMLHYAGRHWRELSPELQHALSAAVGYTVDEATMYIEQDDYPVPAVNRGRSKTWFRKIWRWMSGR